MKPPRTRRRNNRPLNKTEQELHYESVTRFLIWAVGISATLITVIITVGLYFTYSSVNDIKDDYRNTINDLKAQITDLKNDANASVGSLKQEAKESVNEIKQQAKETVTETQNYTESELSRIAISTNQLALDETKKQLADIFGTDRIQNLIQNQAVNEIRQKVELIVQNEIKNLSRINDAASKMRIASQQGMWELKEYFQNPSNTLDSLNAKNLYDKICEDYYETWKDTLYFTIDNVDSLPPVINENAIQPRPVRHALERLVSLIIDKQTDLNTLTQCIVYLSYHTNHKFRPFEIEEIDRWFRSLKFDKSQ